MQKNGKAYAFLLSHSSKNRIYIKRVAVPKNWIHLGSVGLFLIFGISALTIGAVGIIRNTDISQITPSSLTSQISAQTVQKEARIDYTRPGSEQFAYSSGGPENDQEDDGETAQLEAQLKQITLTSDPANLPTMWAHLGKINNEFGFRRNPFGGRSYEFHPGMDIDGERGDPVVAPANGSVKEAGYKGGYGNMVEIDHGNGLTTRYAHMSKLEATGGSPVTRGQVIGYVGSTGRSTGPHLHYELRLNDRPINPRHFLPAEPVDLAMLRKK